MIYILMSFFFSTGFDVALEVLQCVVSELDRRGDVPGWTRLPLLVTWVCQQMPGNDLLAAAIESAAYGRGLIVLAVFVSPPQVGPSRRRRQRNDYTAIEGLLL